MADSPLIDIFDLCVERLAAGETVDDCLRDYPAYADDLRSLLTMSVLLFEAEANTTDEQQAQAQTRTRIEQVLQTDFIPKGQSMMSSDKEKRSTPSLRRSVFWIGASAAAVFALTFGFAFAASGAQPIGRPVADASLYMTSVFLRDVLATEAAREVTIQVGADQDDLFILTATAYVREVTQTAIAEVLAAGTPLPTMVNEDDFKLTATAFVREITQAAQSALEPTLVPMITLDASATATVTTTSTPLPTSTPLSTLLAPMGTMTAASPVLNMALPTEAAGTGGDTAITGEFAATSVASYLPMTATPAALMSVDDKEVGGSAGVPAPAVLAREAESDASTDEERFDGTLPLDGDSLAEPLSADLMAMPTMVMPYGTPVLSSVVVSQQQLNALNAGEIDDNAEWDTYMEFRRNFMSGYGAQSVLDFDVSGRRIIKVVDAMGQPILGARVEVYMEQERVSDTRTYATGLTLFFPNALESTRRRDTFQVLITVDQYQVTQTLDLRTVGDVFEIQMPLVIVRDAQAQSADQNAAVAAQQATFAAQNAAVAAQQATLAAQSAAIAIQQATLAAQNAPMATPFPTLTPSPTHTMTPIATSFTPPIQLT